MSACRSENARIRSGRKRFDLVESGIDERCEARFPARLGRSHGVPRDTDDAIAFTNQVERFGGFLREGTRFARGTSCVGYSLLTERTGWVAVGPHVAQRIAGLNIDQIRPYRGKCQRFHTISLVAAILRCAPAAARLSCLNAGHAAKELRLAMRLFRAVVVAFGCTAFVTGSATGSERPNSSVAWHDPSGGFRPRHCERGVFGYHGRQRRRECTARQTSTSR